MAEPVADRPVEVLTGDRADDAAVLLHLDAGGAAAAAAVHGLLDGRGGIHEPGGSGHDVTSTRSAGDRLRQAVDDPAADVVEPGAADDRRCRLGVAAAAHRRQGGSHVELGHAASADHEHPPLHGHPDDERPAVAEVDHLARQRGDALDIPGPVGERELHLDTGSLLRLGCLHEGGQKRPLVGPQRRVEERRDQLLGGAVAGAEAERLDVADGRRREGERPRVLVDAERQRGRLGRGGVDAPLGQDADHGRGERTILAGHIAARRHPRRRGRVAVVVEEHRLHPLPRRHLGEVAQAGQVRRLDHDQTRNGRGVDARGVAEVELVGVQGNELAHVAVHPALQAERGRRVQPTSSQRGSEPVEVGVGMGDDELLRPHERILRTAIPARYVTEPSPDAHVEQGGLAPLFRASRWRRRPRPRRWRRPAAPPPGSSSAPAGRS